MSQLKLDGITGQVFSTLGQSIRAVLSAGKVVYARSIVRGQVALSRNVHVRESSPAIPILGRRIDVKNFWQDTAF